MGKLLGVRCFWCKRELSTSLDTSCSCFGHGRRRFHIKVWWSQLASRMRQTVELWK